MQHFQVLLLVFLLDRIGLNWCNSAHTHTHTPCWWLQLLYVNHLYEMGFNAYGWRLLSLCVLYTKSTVKCKIRNNQVWKKKYKPHSYYSIRRLFFLLTISMCSTLPSIVFGCGCECKCEYIMCQASQCERQKLTAAFYIIHGKRIVQVQWKLSFPKLFFIFTCSNFVLNSFVHF